MSGPTMFLKLTVKGRPVRGDATVAGYEQQIVIDSCNWQTSAEHRSVDGDARTTLTHGHLRLGKVFDRASTALYGYIKDSAKVETAALTLVDASLHGDRTLKLMEMELAGCYLESLSARGADAGSVMRVTEEFMLSFETGVLRYHPSDPSAPGRSAPTEYRIPKPRTRDRAAG